MAASGPHDAVARMVGVLNRLYREEPALHARDASSDGFEWFELLRPVEGTDADKAVYVTPSGKFTGKTGLVLGVKYTF